MSAKVSPVTSPRPAVAPSRSTCPVPLPNVVNTATPRMAQFASPAAETFAPAVPLAVKATARKSSLFPTYVPLVLRAARVIPSCTMAGLWTADG